jgi:hypothetical protein
LAGAIANPGVYSILFVLKGRGHDGTEFQEAQAAMGFSYSGHSVDYLFLFLFIAGLMILWYKLKLTCKIAGRFLIGVILTFSFLVALQITNNRIFDPVFQSSIQKELNNFMSYF